MHLIVFPSVTQITFCIVEAQESAFEEKPQTTWRQIIVFMNLRQTLIEIEGLVIHWMAEGYFHPI